MKPPLLIAILVLLAGDLDAQTNGCAIEILSSPPASTQSGALISNSVFRAFREHSTLVLPVNVQVDFHGDGWLLNAPPSAGQSATLAQGTAIASWLLHQDTTIAAVTLSATITFDRNILGVMVNSQTLNAFDLTNGLGAPGTAYSADSRRDLEFSSLDNIAISGRSLYVQFETPDFLDDLRVVTEPGSSIVNVTCTTGGCGGNSGCPCGNDAVSGAGGCENSGSHGARLYIGGPNFVPSTSPALFDMSVVVTSLPPARNCLFAMSGTATTPGTVFGAGLRCLGPGTIYRIQVVASDSLGMVVGANLIQGVNALVQPNNLIAPGTVWNFQVLYRDPVGVGTCPAATANATNSVRVPFL